jgi:hypothetical protein
MRLAEPREVCCPSPKHSLMVSPSIPSPNDRARRRSSPNFSKAATTGVFVSSAGDEMAADADDGDAGHVSTACMTSEVRTWGRRSDTFDMMRLWSRWKSVRALGRSATPSSGLQAEAGEMIDFGADGGAMSWRSSRAKPKRSTQSIRASSSLGGGVGLHGRGEHPRANGILGPLGELLGGWACPPDAGHVSAAYISPDEGEGYLRSEPSMIDREPIGPVVLTVVQDVNPTAATAPPRKLGSIPRNTVMRASSSPSETSMCWSRSTIP